MSGNVAGTGMGIMPFLIDNAGVVRSKLDTLTQQISTGLKAHTYAGLGAGAATSLSLSPQIASLKTYGSAIDAVSGQIGVTQTTLQRIEAIAQQFAGKIPNLNGLNPTAVDSIASDARDALGQVADLLNAKYGDTYVLSGQDASNPPVPEASQILSSGFYTQINAAVTSLSSSGAAAVTASTLATAQSNDAGTSPFSAYLSQPASAIALPVIQAGPDTFLPMGAVASANTGAVSGGTATTGSYIRDLMRSLATLGSLSSSQVNDAGFAALVSDTGSSLNSAVSAMGTDIGILGDRSAQLTAMKSHLADVTIAMTAQVSDVQEIDVAAALSSLSNVQAQLQQSYRLIVNTATLSLANFIPA